MNYIGVRFSPSDEDLIDYVRKKAVGRHEHELSFIPDLNIYAQPPWIASKMIDFSLYAIEEEFYCFCSVKRSSTKDNRLKRTTPGGYWCAKGHVKSYRLLNGQVFGTMTPLKFFLDGGCGNGEVKKRKLTESRNGTIWVMNEYRLSAAFWNSEFPEGTQEVVLCKISPTGTGLYNDERSCEDSTSDIDSNKRVCVQEASTSATPPYVSVSSICNLPDSRVNLAQQTFTFPTANRYYHQESRTICDKNLALTHEELAGFAENTETEAMPVDEFDSQNVSAPTSNEYEPAHMDNHFSKISTSTHQDIAGLSYEITNCRNDKEMVPDSASTDVSADFSDSLDLEKIMAYDVSAVDEFLGIDFSIDVLEFESIMQSEFSSSSMEQAVTCDDTSTANKTEKTKVDNLTPSSDTAVATSSSRDAGILEDSTICWSELQQLVSAEYFQNFCFGSSFV